MWEVWEAWTLLPAEVEYQIEYLVGQEEKRTVTVRLQLEASGFLGFYGSPERTPTTSELR